MNKFKIKNRDARKLFELLSEILTSEIEFSYIKKIVKFYITEIEPDFDIDKNLTKTQKMLYWLDDSTK